MTTAYEEGNPNAQILILAEAPSHSEIRLGRPLCGPSGNVFNDCLHAAGIARRQCYILNVWPFLVKKDEKKGLFYPAEFYGHPDKILFNKKGFTEFGLFKARHTVELIKKSGANVILAMGRPAMNLCVGNRPIMKWRGSPMFSENLGKKVIPTVHPASTLHGTYVWRYLIIKDMEKVAEEARSPTLTLPVREILTDPTHRDVLDYLHYLRTLPRFATDLEVINHQVNCYSLAESPSHAMVVPMADEFGNAWWDEGQEYAIWKAYAEVMGDPKVEKINQNIIGFDVPFLYQQNNIFTEGFLGDTMIAQKLMYPDFNKGLDFITSIHTREPYYKDEGKMWRGHGGDIEQFWRYCGKDAMVALEAWHLLKQEMHEGGYWETYQRVARLAKPITYMTARGMKVDHDKLKATHSRVEIQIAQKEDELARVAKYPFNVSSPKQCQLYFYGTCGIAPYKGKDGGITTDDKALARIFRRHRLPEAKLVQEIRALRKLKGTYLEVDCDKDGRLRCSWDPTGTWTGRLSSSGTVFGTGMNQQNLHPDFKEFLVADDD